MKKSMFPGVLLLSSILLFGYCSKDESYMLSFDDTEFETLDWSETTHSKEADPDYAEVFSDTEVKRLDLVISAERWQGMLDNMEERYGEFGASRGGPGLTTFDDNPIFVPGEVFYKGTQWYRVGLRFKGNSSLQSSWESGVLKLSFKLDFDEFEDEYPQIDDQRFYGFKKFSLKNNYADASLMREKVGSDIFRSAGIASSRTAFYTLYVDHGDGPEYFGLYTLVEEVDNTVIKSQFSEDKGNVYKPDGDGASFAQGSFDESEFEKKTNEEEADWSDIQQLFTALHAGSRDSDPIEWRSNLGRVFDTDVFLKYLAVNTVIQNWDTYGRMTHNYYLYNNPENDLLTWIPWDNNEAFQSGKQGGAHALNFSGLSETTWPLIGYMYADPVYKAQYNRYVQEVIDGPFKVNTISDLYSRYELLLEPYATTERSGFTFLSNPSSFSAAVASLKAHVASRTTAVQGYL